MNQRLRHCMVVHAHYPLGETLVQRQAEALMDHGIEVEVVCLRLPGERPLESVNGVQVHRLDVQRRTERNFLYQFVEYLNFFARATVYLTRLHLKSGFDVIQVHDLPDFLVFCAIVPRWMGARVFLQIRDLMPEFFAARTGRPADDPLVGLIALQEQISCRFAEHVVTVTEAWRQVLIARGVPPDKCSVVMNLADTRYFYPVRDRRERKAPDLHVVYHGSLAYRYGVDLVLEAVAMVRNELPGLRVSILGGGEERERLIQRASELHLDDIVQFSKNYLGLDELVPILRCADVGVVPNRNDPFTDSLVPTKLLEYAAMEMPAIAARTRGIESYFDGEMVEFFEPDSAQDLAKAIRRLYRDPARRRALGETMAAFNRRHNWSEESERYVRFVDSFAAGNRGATRDVVA